MQSYLFFLIVCLCLPTAHSSTFTDYCSDYNKSYSESQRPLRERVFKERCEQIESANAQNLGYELAVNNFTDWTEEEIRRYSYAAVDVSAPVAQVPARQPGRVSYPQSKDWRAEGKVTPVRQQGSCGGCWAFSSTAVFESMLAITANRMEDLSEEYIVECANRAQSDCTGGFVVDAFQLMSKSGMPGQSQFPYKGTTSGSTTPTTPGICSADTPYRLSGTTTYATYRNLTNEQLRDLVAVAPVVALIYADTSFTAYKSGVFACARAVQSASDLNHAVAVVGYDGTRFILKNSYGAGWGDGGFMSISPSADCGIKLYVYQLINTPDAKKGAWALELGAVAVLLTLMMVC